MLKGQKTSPGGGAAVEPEARRAGAGVEIRV